MVTKRENSFGKCTVDDATLNLPPSSSVHLVPHDGETEYDDDDGDELLSDAGLIVLLQSSRLKCKSALEDLAPTSSASSSTSRSFSHESATGDMKGVSV